LRLLRSMYRKLAIHHRLTTSSNAAEIVLVDEGIIHLAHIIHGRSSSPKNASLDLDALAEFSTLAPKPHLLVWVKAPLHVLEQRIRARNTHQPLPGQSAADRRDFLRLADMLTTAVVNEAFPLSRVISIENHQQNSNDLKQHAQHVADAIGKFTDDQRSGNALADQQSFLAA